MPFALVAFASIAWSLTMLRWSIARRRSPWSKRVAAVSLAVIAAALLSIVNDAQAMWSWSTAPRSDVLIAVADLHDWWQLSYSRRGQSFLTANELHVPAHSRVTILWLGPPPVVERSPAGFFVAEQGRFDFVASESGVLDLQLVHGRRLRIVADSASQFDTWFDVQVRRARTDPRAPLFVNSGCGYCHVLRGVTESPSVVAPDLTHFASRTTIAATGLPNKRAILEGWIANSQAIKASSQMPDNNVAPAVLHSLASYLESLQ